MNISRALKESFLDCRLQMAAPLALFIGIEQAFIYADFSKVGQIHILRKCVFGTNGTDIWYFIISTD